ncbi:CGNR zinc finger domain-containing protein [Actinocatenispora sera]|uniref:CGNR zinc finger domain-containing protein n=1 Tax=Actinocatenispora sera TaxID=390989 RepID=UPI0034066D05
MSSEQVVRLSLALSGTLRHDGAGGVADDLADVPGLASWLRAEAEPLRSYLGGVGTADEPTRAAVVSVRLAMRSLFAEAVRPEPPSRADAHALLPSPVALDRLNLAAAAVPVHPVLGWPDAAAPTVAWRGEPDDERSRLAAGLARAAIEFLSSPNLDQLRACQAPRCVRYFVRSSPRQQWCRPSCGNRARVARHYQRHAGTA